MAELTEKKRESLKQALIQWKNVAGEPGNTDQFKETCLRAARIHRDAVRGRYCSLQLLSEHFYCEYFLTIIVGICILTIRSPSAAALF